MRTGRPVTPIVLTREERRVLRRWSKLEDHVSSRLGVRARIILALAQPSAMSGSAVAEQIRIPQQTVSLWRRRFVAGRLAGLQHRRRSPMG